MHSPTPPLRLIIEPRNIMKPLLRGHTKWRVSRSVVSDSLWPHGLQPSRLLSPWNSPGKNTGVGCHSLLQGIFPTQGWNLVLLHCRQILYHLSCQGSQSPSGKSFSLLILTPWILPVNDAMKLKEDYDFYSFGVKIHNYSYVNICQIFR